MAQTKEGAEKARETIRKRYGLTADGKSKLHMAIGSKGGKKSGTGGFWYLKYVKGDTEKIQEIGKRGGRARQKK